MLKSRLATPVLALPLLAFAAPASGAGSGDLLPPSTPLGITVTQLTHTSVSIGWTGATDNVGVAGYDVYRDGSPLGTTSSTGYTLSGLACGTPVTLGVDAYDAAGNHSARATVS